MRRSILFVVVLALIAGGVAFWFLRLRVKAPERVICGRLATLCGVASAEERCVAGARTIKKVIGEEALAKVGRCVSRAPSCVAATGCLTGVGAGVLGDFIKGLVTGLDIDGKKLGRSLLGAIKSATDTYGKVADGVASGLSAVAKAPKAALDAVGKQLDRAKGAAVAGVKGVKDTVAGATGAAAAGVKKLKDTAAGAKVQVAKGIDQAKKTLDEQVDGLRKGVGAARDKIGEVTDKVGVAAGKVGETVKDGVGSAIDETRRLGRGLLDRVGLGSKADAAPVAVGAAQRRLEAKLDAAVKVVEALTAKKDYARAALSLLDIAWRRGTCGDAARDAAQIRRYRKKRQTLRKAIERSLGRATRK